MTGRMPALEWVRGRCPECGATTIEEANRKCRPSSDQTGEVSCPAERDDDEGFLLFPTAESLARVDAWCDATANAEGWNGQLTDSSAKPSVLSKRRGDVGAGSVAAGNGTEGEAGESDG